MKYIFFTALSLYILTASCALPLANRVLAQSTAPQQQCDAQAQEEIIQKQGLTIVYPRQNSIIDSTSTFLIGSCPTSATLRINGNLVKLNAQGYFAQVVPLSYGKNQFVITGGTADGTTVTLNVTRTPPSKPLPEWPLKMEAASMTPAQDLGVSAGDLIDLSVKASPNSVVTAFIGSRAIKLQPLAKQGIAQKLNAEYGVANQNHEISPDIYAGFYRVNSDDHFPAVKPTFVLQKNKNRLVIHSNYGVTLVDQPRIAITTHDDTVVRVGPGLSRTTPLASGVRLLVDGWQGNNIRCLLAPGKHVFIAKDDLQFENANTVPPSSVIRTINLAAEPSGDSGTRVVVPLSQRLPYQIEQSINPNRLNLRIFGATSDTDWITPSPDSLTNELIDKISWNQKMDHVYELAVQLKGTRQWGYWVSYDGDSLVLHIKSPPKLLKDGRSLSGITICLDPGHGGSEPGAYGPDGTPEAEINFDIAEKLKPLLEANGAKVIMTRQTEADGPSLSERVAMAVNGKADLLISIHNNALPDGRDPLLERGTSSHWYQPQSLELARSLKDDVRVSLGFSDKGCFYQNLALCRPSQMPATLVEVGFMINPDEFYSLSRPETQDKAAHALLNGIKGYIRR